MVSPMARWLTERRLSQVSARLKSLRGELAVMDEQLLQFTDDADELSLRALMSETPMAAHEARKHLAAMRKHRAHILAEIEELEQSQDRLLDQLTG